MSARRQEEWRDLDPPPAEWKVTDFSEIWKLGLSGAEPDPEPVIEMVHRKHATERVEMDVEIPVRLGRHEWLERRHLTSYRTVKPDVVPAPVKRMPQFMDLFESRFEAMRVARVYGYDIYSHGSCVIARGHGELFVLQVTNYDSVLHGAIFNTWWTRMKNERGSA